jgi:hypothetical protein
MKNFIILLFIFFLVFLLIAFIAPDSMFIFFYIYLALIISALCLMMYVGGLRGIILLVIFILSPFLLEYLFSLLKLPFFSASTIVYLSARTINLPVNAGNLIILFNIPTLLICSLFFSQKLKMLFNIKILQKTFLVIYASILLGLNFLQLGLQKIEYSNAIKWLAISALIYISAIKLIKFKIEIPDFFKEIPIVLFLLIYSFNYALTGSYYFLIITGVLLILYLFILYTEHQYKKISQTSGV